jgi:hypothetical protein
MGEGLPNSLRRCFQVAILFAASVGCFSCGDASVTVVISNTEPIVAFPTYQFSARVDQITGSPPFGVAIGDTLTGSFAYQSNAPDRNAADINQGYFHHMSAPSGIEFRLNSLNFIAYPDSYSILIHNNDINVIPLEDRFEIHAQANQDSNMSIAFILRDLTAAAFSTSSCNVLPSSLYFPAFNSNTLLISYIGPGSGGWSIRLVPERLSRAS